MPQVNHGWWKGTAVSGGEMDFIH